MVPSRSVSLMLAICTALVLQAFAVTQPKEATPFTKNRNAGYLLPPLDYSDTGDFDRVTRGLVATTNSLVIRSMTGDGRAVWNMDRFAFIQGDTVPDTVNPSLWRQARLNNCHGLYEVISVTIGGETRTIWQVRGYDMSNITFVEGDQGFIVIDPLTSQETAKAAVDFFYANIPEAIRSKLITHIIFTHSHTDHYGGVRAVLNSGRMAPQYEICAPVEFSGSRRVGKRPCGSRHGIPCALYVWIFAARGRARFCGRRFGQGQLYWCNQPCGSDDDHQRGFGDHPLRIEH